MERSKRAVIIPAYNEEATIDFIIRCALQYARVILVDDGSHDDTVKIAKRCGAEVICNGSNQGYDYSLAKGFELAKSLNCKAIVTMDADGEHDPKILPQFFESIESGTQLVIGQRPKTNRIAETVIGYYIKWRYKVHDILCGMKGYHIDLINKLGISGDRKSIGTELTIKAIRRGYTFIEIKLPDIKRKDQSRFGSGIKANWIILISLLRVLNGRI